MSSLKKALLSAMLFVGALGSGAQALASPPAIPRSMTMSQTGLITQGLGSSCYILDLEADTLPCNPAFVAKERESRFRGNLYFGNNLTYTREVMDLLNGDANSETVSRLFEKRDSSELETNIEGGYLTETWGVAVSPFRVNYFTLFRNSALPEVTLYASQEESARAQFATYLGHDFYVGLQIRYLQRKFISRQFFLTDALAENGNDLFQPEHQKAFFAEPSLLYSMEHSDWKPEFSVSIMNLGVTDHRYSVYSQDPEPHLGASINPKWGWGQWGLGVDTFFNQSMALRETVTLGSYYKLGILKVFGSIAQNDQGLGFQTTFAHFDLGVVMNAKTTEDALGDQTTTRRVYLLLGVEI